MSPEVARALALAYTLHDLLGELFEEYGAGSKVEAAWDHTDEVIELLETTPGAPRLLVTGPPLARCGSMD